MSQQLAFQDEASEFLGVKEFGTDGPSECIQRATKVPDARQTVRPPAAADTHTLAHTLALRWLPSGPGRGALAAWVPRRGGSGALLPA
jgi:hypothetical protein